MTNEDIIKFINENCRVCDEADKEWYKNCENCYLLKEFLENSNSPK